MPALKSIHQQWIVRQLAIFETPTAVAKAFAEEFGFPISKQRAWDYDCSKAINRDRRAVELVALFDETRAEYQAAVKDIPIANKVWRLARMQEMFEAAVESRRAKAAMAILEQAAKDDGDAFTNKRDLTSGGAPFKALVGISIEDV